MSLPVAIVCFVIALFFLGVLAVTDMKTRLLPNAYVAGFGVTGLVFHAAHAFRLVTPADMAAGMICGAGLLFAVRLAANTACKRDTLGLGDVKLMGAAGLWLGMAHIFVAITLGACAGLIHGIIYKFYTERQTGEKIAFSTLSIPAGPGFIIGILVVAAVKFQNFLSG